MNTKMIICLFGAALLFSVSIAEAQQPKKVPRIGLLVPSSSDSTRKDVFLQGLRDLGYVEERTLRLSTDTQKGS